MSDAMAQTLYSRLARDLLQLYDFQAADTCTTAEPMTASLPPKYTSKASTLPGSGLIPSKKTTSCTLHCMGERVVSE
jgi:hypothetical protein